MAFLKNAYHKNTRLQGQDGKVPDRDELFTVVPYNPEGAEEVSAISYSYWKSVFYYFSRKKVTMVLLIVLILLLIASFLMPVVGKYHYKDLVADSELAFISPCSEFWFGTDNIGRDYFSQVWAASRTSISLAVLVAAGQTLLGVAFGLVWGYVRKMDGLFTFLFNLVDNVPTIIYLTLISFIIGQGFSIMSVSLILIGWLGTALNVRNMVIMLRDREFNTESRCLGTPTGRILIKNILPQLISVLILSLTLSIPETIAMESTLSFLGLGLGIDTPSLGLLLQNARRYFIDYPYLLIIPSIIVSLITITFYLVGNAFADASDPKNHR